jgi:hypothetical protein
MKRKFTLQFMCCFFLFYACDKSKNLVGNCKEVIEYDQNNNSTKIVFDGSGRLLSYTSTNLSNGTEIKNYWEYDSIANVARLYTKEGDSNYFILLRRFNVDGMPSKDSISKDFQSGNPIINYYYTAQGQLGYASDGTNKVLFDIYNSAKGPSKITYNQNPNDYVSFTYTDNKIGDFAYVPGAYGGWQSPFHPHFKPKYYIATSKKIFYNKNTDSDFEYELDELGRITSVVTNTRNHGFSFDAFGNPCCNYDNSSSNSRRYEYMCK